ncbi:MAG: FecR domain-containing protein [Puia sp.]|nr:FecR domain-containing protein [Puia sp.]
MSKTTFEELFHKFLEETITAEELARFRELFDDERNHALRDELLEGAFVNKAFQETADYDPGEVFRELLTRIGERETPAETTGPKAPVVSLPGRSPGIASGQAARLRSVAAVILLAMLGSLAYFFAGHKHPSPPPVATGRQVGAPGSNKAFLTLADGSIVTLDSVQNGTLPDQGNSRVVKLDSGILAYHTTDNPGGEPVYNLITTPRGGQYRIVLPDGTRAWLNSASSLRFPTSFSGKERAVTLTGEGYFEVTRNPSMPFVVAVGAMKVNVLGTGFNIMAYADEAAVKTTLAEGSVQIVSGNNRALLKPGQQAQLSAGDNNPAGGRIRVIDDADVEEVLAWKNGRFQFNETNIESIMRQVGRWYDVDIEYRGDLSGIELSGAISRKEYAAQLLELLEATKRVRFATEGGKIIVIPYRQ